MSVKVRDLDYVNRRQKLPSVALPPEVRARLGLTLTASETDLEARGGRSSQVTLETKGLHERPAKGGESEDLYVGAAMVAAIATSGASGSGTDWVNPRGHSFVRRGTAQQRLASLQDLAKEKRRMATFRSHRGL
mmetsp:Transcript_53916/g.97080  ORF Transcript_53916/g.97080 Transcript_53916/m.97080 type:complete len:134 (-) Transcript_53916:22-423(-)